MTVIDGTGAVEETGVEVMAAEVEVGVAAFAAAAAAAGVVAAPANASCC